MHRGSLGAGDWIQLNGPFNLLNIDSVTFRVADAAAGRTAGSPLAAIEVRQDSVDRADRGDVQPGLDRRHRPSGRARRSRSRWRATHELFLVFRTVTGGADRQQPVQPQLGRVRRAGIGPAVGPGRPRGPCPAAPAVATTITLNHRGTSGEGTSMGKEISVGRRKFTRRRRRRSRRHRARAALGRAALSSGANRGERLVPPGSVGIQQFSIRDSITRLGVNISTGRTSSGQSDADDGLPRRPELPGRPDRPRPARAASRRLRGDVRSS